MRIRRLMEMPKIRILKKIIGYDEIYTIAIRNVQNNEYIFNNVNGIFRCIPYSGHFWYADPISFSWKGKDYLFVEEFDRKINKGHIAVTEIFEDISNISFHAIIKEDYHMSFPMVFEWDGSIYMIPETSQNRSINLYHATDFPYSWELECSFDVGCELVDTVIVEKREKLVLLSSEVNSKNPLEVRYRRYILEKGTGYRLSRYENDTYSLDFNLSDRNAGRTLKYNDSNILPTQKSTECDYGVFLVFRRMEIDVYPMIQEVGPGDVKIENILCKNIIGIHTYSRTDNIEIIDLRYLKFSPLNQWRKIYNNLSKKKKDRNS